MNNVAAGNPRAYRWRVASRALAAAIGGYVLTSLITAALSLLLPRLFGAERAEAVLIATLISYLIFTLIVLWVFATRSLKRAWLGILIPSVVLGVAVYLLR